MFIDEAHRSKKKEKAHLDELLKRTQRKYYLEQD